MATYYKKTMSDKEYYLSQALRPLRPNKTSQYRGVSRNSKSEKEPFRAMITHKGKRYYLGSFATELEAAKAYNKAALAIIGSYAIINQLPEESNG
jgi:AP2 domain